MNQKRIYLDNAASTRTDPEVVKAMLPYFEEKYAVASSQFSHSPGILAREGLDNAREIIARKINASTDEIVFTSGGTEANNLVIKGTAWAHREEKKHLVCSKVEHNSVLHSCQWLEKEGFQLTLIDVDEEGFIDLDQLRESISDKTFLVSIQHGNQEVGTIQSIEEIGKICKEKGTLFHVDAALSFTLLDLDVDRIKTDLMSFSAHKIHGPKGIGALYVRKGTPIKKIIHGGYSEFDLRAGTENVAGAVGFGKAVELAQSNNIQFIQSIQKGLLEKMEKEVEDFEINGPRDLSKRLPGNLNLTYNFIEGESVVLHLDMKGISVITGSACFSRSLEPSYVMMAMGYSHERAHGSIRFALSRFNNIEEIERVVTSCKDVVDSLRRISPLRK
jgi:cysteine desulfurase